MFSVVLSRNKSTKYSCKLLSYCTPDLRSPPCAYKPSIGRPLNTTPALLPPLYPSPLLFITHSLHPNTLTEPGSVLEAQAPVLTEHSIHRTLLTFFQILPKQFLLLCYACSVHTCVLKLTFPLGTFPQEGCQKNPSDDFFFSWLLRFLLHHRIAGVPLSGSALS